MLGVKVKTEIRLDIAKMAAIGGSQAVDMQGVELREFHSVTDLDGNKSQP